jgi:hypothetical protein
METRWTVTQTTLRASVLRMVLSCEVFFSDYLYPRLFSLRPCSQRIEVIADDELEM